MNASPYYPQHFQIDSLGDNAYSGFTDGSRWNGFATPCFTQGEAERLLNDMLAEDTLKSWGYDSSADTFYVTQNDSTEEESYSAIDIMVKDSEIHVYPIGAFSWVWLEVNYFDWDNLAEISADRVTDFAEQVKTPPVNPPAQSAKNPFYFKTIYSVTQEMQGGYLPNGIAYFATKAEAESYMKDRKRSAIEDGYKVTGSAKDGFYSLMPADSDDHTLGESITLQTGSASMFAANIPSSVDSIDSLVQYLNDNYA